MGIFSWENPLFWRCFHAGKGSRLNPESTWISPALGSSGMQPGYSRGFPFPGMEWEIWKSQRNSRFTPRTPKDEAKRDKAAGGGGDGLKFFCFFFFGMAPGSFRGCGRSGVSGWPEGGRGEKRFVRAGRGAGPAEEGSSKWSHKSATQRRLCPGSGSRGGWRGRMSPTPPCDSDSDGAVPPRGFQPGGIPAWS